MRLNNTGCSARRSGILPAVMLVLVIALAMVLPAGCQSKTTSESTTGATEASSQTTSASTTAESTAAPTTEATTIPTTAATTVDPNAPRSMLTGESLKDGETGRERPIAVMINNIRVATPQIGIGQADLLFETQVEGGITRLMAVFSNVADIPELGSIRSARHNYIDLAGGLDALLVHVGASYLANNQFSAQKTAHIDLHVYPDAYWRDTAWMEDRGYEHSVKTTGKRLEAALVKGKFRTEVREEQKSFFAFRAIGDFVPADGQAALEITAPFSDYCVATFSYDAAAKVYSKGEFGKPQIDLATGEPLQFTNVLLLPTSITIAESILKEIDLSKGKGYYISGGQYQEINWKKGKTDDSFVFTDMNGDELQVNTGKSYIGILSKKETITIK